MPARQSGAAIRLRLFAACGRHGSVCANDGCGAARRKAVKPITDGAGRGIALPLGLDLPRRRLGRRAPLPVLQHDRPRVRRDLPVGHAAGQRLGLVPDRPVRRRHRGRRPAAGRLDGASVRHGRHLRRLHHVLVVQPADAQPGARRAVVAGRGQHRLVPRPLPCRRRGWASPLASR